MTIDPAVVPGLLILAAELIALASVGFVVARVALGQSDDRVALAQGAVIGPALWGLIVNFVLHAIPGRPGAIIGWAAILALGAVMAWRVSTPMRPPARTLAGFAVAALAIFWVALASRQFLGLPDPHIQLGQAATMQAGGAHPAGAALEPRNAGTLPLWRQPAYRPPGTAGRTRSGVHHGVAERVHLDELRSRGGHNTHPARVVADHPGPCAAPHHGWRPGQPLAPLPPLCYRAAARRHQDPHR